MIPRLLAILDKPNANLDTFDLKVQTMNYKAGRHCLIRYALRENQSSETLEYIGKVFAKGRRAARLWQVLEQVHQAALSNTPVPTPLAFFDDLDLVLMERLKGADMLSLLTGGDEAATRNATRLAAKALAAFHEIPISEGKLGSLEEELASLRKHTEQFGAAAPQVAERATRLLDQIENVAAKLPEPPVPSLMHTGFRPDAIFVDAERAAFLDLDGWTIGDPALDIGGYCAEVWNESREPGQGHLLAYRDLFLEQYVKTSALSGVTERALLYEAFTLVRLTLRRLRRMNRDTDRGPLMLPAEELLTRAEECLATIAG